MNTTTKSFLLVILCFLQNGIKAAVSTNLGEQWVYLYQANTTVRNSLSSDVASQWSLSAKLIIQSYKDYKIMKLEDIKTTAYNGLTSTTPNLPDVQIPKGTDVLTEPFIVHYNRDYEKLERLNFLPNEAQWSINIKKSVASIFQVDFTNIPKNGESNEPNEELNIYGKCKVDYKNLSANSTITISKEINANNCIIEHSPRHTWAHINLGYFTGQITRNYTYNKLVTDSTSPAKRIKSEALFQYWVMKSDRTIHRIEQTQQFDFVSSSPITKKSDISSYTLKKLPVYEFENTTRQTVPESKEYNVEHMVQQFLQLKRQANDNRSIDLDEQRFNIVEKLLKSLATMDLETLQKEDFKAQNQIKNLFTSILPYVGTEASVELIKEMIQNNTQIDLNELRLLGMFPLYVKSPNEDLLKKMEKLLDIEELKGVRETVKQTYILSFSNLVYQMYYGKLERTNNPTLAQEFYKNIAKKYVQKYYEHYTASNDYSTKMKYILGMMNMGEAASSQLMSIVQNTTESRHIRALAIYSIKPEMMYRKREAYQLFWPLVKNATESFQIRAAALSLLLSSNINSSELYRILSYMNQTSYDASRQHLHNYFYTAILSGKTDCDYCTMKRLAQTMLKDLQSPETNQGLMTSYHQVSYSDDEFNFETSLDVHVVANPITNFVNIFQVTLNHFVGHHKTGEYSVYIKAEGISSKLYKEEYERHYAIKELYKILQEVNLGLMEDMDEDLHIEMIVFYEQRAIFALFINRDNIEEMADYIDKIILYIGNNDIVTMRDVRNLHFVSDMGTPIHATLKYEHVLGTEFKNYDKIFLGHQGDDDENYVLTRVRSMWMSKLNFQSYNPLTNTNHGVSKIFSNQNLIKFKIDYNVYELSIKMNDDTSYFDTLIDHKYAIFVDNDNILPSYCSDCKSVVYLTQNETTEKELNLWLWIKDIKIKEINCTNPRFAKDPLHEIIKKSRVSYTGLPFAQPFVLLTYICDYLYYIPQYDICSTSIKSEKIVKEPNLSTLKITFINDALDENYKLNLNFNITLALIQRAIKSKKILNQWNLNLQRQEELDKGVYYELHYDDNGRTVQFDVHSDLDYVPTTPDSDMFSLRPADPIISRTSIHLKEDSAISNVEITSLFSVSNEQIEMVNRSKSLELCQKDYEKDYFRDLPLKHTPPTKTCYNSSLGFATYDNYAIYLEFHNISDKVRKTLEDDVLKPLKNIGSLEDKPVITESTFNVSLVYSALPSMFNIDMGKNHIVANYSVPELLRPKALLKPTNRLIEELRYNAFGLDNLCIIIPRYVITFTGKIVEHDTDTSIIPLIECTNTTRIGLTSNRFTYKLWSDENTFQFGKKEGGYYVMRNGKYLRKDVRAEDYSVDFLNENTFHIITSRIELYYNGEYLTVRIKSAFIDRMCGMCVTGEITTPNMMSKYFN